jgi:hypothetical protein
LQLSLRRYGSYVNDEKRRIGERMRGKGLESWRRSVEYCCES